MNRASSRSGFALVASLAILFVMFTIAMALQYTTSTNRNNLMIAQADFETEVQLANQEANDQALLSGFPLTSKTSQKMSINLKKSDGYDSEVRNTYGSGNTLWRQPPKAVFERPSPTPTPGSGWHQYNQYIPTSKQADMRIGGKQGYSVLYSASFPYAAFAPRGNIKLSDALPWGNVPSSAPRNKARTLKDFESGVPVLLGAQKDIKVTNSFPHGEAYTADKDGTISLNSTGALAFYGRLPYQSKKAPYQATLLSQVQTAVGGFGRVTKAGDKTAFVNTESPISAKGLLDCLMSFGEVSLPQMMAQLTTPSVNQAMKFSLPMIPTFSTDVVYTELTFHMPFPPDQSVIASLAASEASKYIDQMNAKLQKSTDFMKTLGPKITALNAQFDQQLAAQMDKVVGPLQQQLSQAQQTLQNAQNQLSQAQQQLSGLGPNASAAAQQAAQAAVASAQQAVSNAQDGVTSLQQNITQQSTAIQDQIKQARDAAVQPLMAQLQDANQQRIDTLNTVADNAKSTLNDIANSNLENLIPLDGYDTRALEDKLEKQFGDLTGIPGTTFCAFAVLFGQSSISLIKKQMQDLMAQMALSFIQKIVPGGRLVADIHDPTGFSGLALHLDIYTGLDLITDPQELEALWSLRHLSLKEAIKEWLKPYMDAIPKNDVRLVNFGDANTPTAKLFSFNTSPDGSLLAKGFKSNTTWTVPRGRTLRFLGDVEISGDLWIQRGAAMQIDGSLTVKPPTDPPPTWRIGDNPLNPNGRIYLEPGATLLVGKDLNVKGGSFDWGSIMVTSPVGEQFPITSSILCQGNVTTAYGIHPGMGIEDIFASKGMPASLQNAYKNFLSPLLNEVAPNAAKIFGPFHIRRPYFCSLSSTLSLYLIIPAPGPEYPNIECKIFDALASLYGVGLNAGLGENLYTHTDWWPFGDGCVPIMPRVDLDALVEAISQIQFPLSNASDAATFFENQLSTFVTGIMQVLVTQVITDVLTQIIKAIADIENISKWAVNAADAAIQVLQGAETSLASLIQKLQDQFSLSMEDAVKKLVYKPVMDLANQIIAQVEAAIDTALLRDCPGLLVYAGGNLSVGDANANPPMAVGMFVARGDVSINADKTVGSIVSEHGNITANKLLYNPFFTHASLYSPKASPDWSTWQTAVFRYEYSQLNDSGTTYEIGPSAYHLTAEGQSQQ